MSNKKTIARIVLTAWSIFLIIAVIIYFMPLPSIPLSITENLWVFPVILIPFIIVIAQSAFPANEEEGVTTINLFEDSEINLSEPMIIELPTEGEQSKKALTTSMATQKSYSIPGADEEPSPTMDTSMGNRHMFDVETERDAVQSLLEGLEKQSTEGKISPDTYQSLKQKYQSRLQYLDNELGRLKSRQS